MGRRTAFGGGHRRGRHGRPGWTRLRLVLLATLAVSSCAGDDDDTDADAGVTPSATPRASPRARPSAADATSAASTDSTASTADSTTAAPVTTDAPTTTVDIGADRLIRAFGPVLGQSIGSAGFVEPDRACVARALEVLPGSVRLVVDRIVEDSAAWHEMAGDERLPVVELYVDCIEPAVLTNFALLATLRATDHLECIATEAGGALETDAIASSLAHGTGFDDLPPDVVDQVTAAAVSCEPDERWWSEDEAFLLERHGLAGRDAACVADAYVDVLGAEAIARRRVLTLEFVPATPEDIEVLDMQGRCGVEMPVAVVELGVRPGDCIDRFGQGARAIEIVDCTRAHNGEVVSVTDLASLFPAWPGVARLRTDADRRCADDVGAIVGGRGGYAAGWDLPDRASWEASARRLTCVLIKPDLTAWVGASGLVPTTATTTTTTTVAAGAGAITDVNTLIVGQCFVGDAAMSDGDLNDGLVEVVDCSIPHQFEVFHVSAMAEPAGTPYPGDEFARNTALGRCHPAFDEYVGRVWAESRLGFTFVYPGQFEWDANYRRILCFLWDRLGGTLTSSMAGSGQ